MSKDVQIAGWMKYGSVFGVVQNLNQKRKIKHVVMLHAMNHIIIKTQRYEKDRIDHRRAV